MAKQGAPFGNKRGRGKKGVSGRKSAYGAEGEEARAKELADNWFGDGLDLKKVREIKEAVKKGEGKIRLFDLYIAKSIKNDRIMSEMFKKLFPDKQISIISELDKLTPDELDNFIETEFEIFM